MKKLIFLDNPYVSLIARVIVGLIFITFGISKIIDPAKFAGEIANYRIMPESILNIMALFIPWIEVVSGLFLLSGVRIKANSVIIGGLLVVFIVAVMIAMMKGLNIYCGCSSLNPQKVGLPKILENSGLLVLTFITFMFPNSKIGLESFIENRLDV